MSSVPGRFKLLFLAVFLFCGILIFIARSEETPAPPKEAAPPPKENAVPATENATPPAKETASPSKEKEEAAAKGAEEAEPGETLALAPPPFTKGIFPCSGCHEDLKPNPTQRKLVKRHKEIVLKHDEHNRWCLDCHDLKDRDKLHLASGKLIDFTESYKLCGQCHGPTLRDWKAGEHGKRTGSWSGAKQYLLCASCHNPHSPKFQPLKPLPPPVRPKDLR